MYMPLYEYENSDYVVGNKIPRDRVPMPTADTPTSKENSKDMRMNIKQEIEDPEEIDDKEALSYVIYYTVLS